MPAPQAKAPGQAKSQKDWVCFSVFYAMLWGWQSAKNCLSIVIVSWDAGMNVSPAGLQSRVIKGHPLMGAAQTGALNACESSPPRDVGALEYGRAEPEDGACCLGQNKTGV